ncbi:MAG: hypothetical protein L0Z55_04035 [Planctomycetes bacterium]|nr:hypothetical protein [Planctomycetota bacterium]
MPNDECSQLIRILLYHGRVREKDLREILRRHGTPMDSAALLAEIVRARLVDEAWAHEVQAVLKLRARRHGATSEEAARIDRSFGQIAIERKWISVANLEAAILEQQRLRRINLYFRVGEIFLNRGLLTVEQVRAILESQGYVQKDCTNCHSIVRVVAGVSEKDPSCPFCHGALTPTIFLDSVQSDAHVDA